jgi:hypothetical protein
MAFTLFGRRFQAAACNPFASAFRQGDEGIGLGVGSRVTGTGIAHGLAIILTSLDHTVTFFHVFLVFGYGGLHTHCAHSDQRSESGGNESVGVFHVIFSKWLLM